jgi:hypothetical protein
MAVRAQKPMVSLGMDRGGGVAPVEGGVRRIAPPPLAGGEVSATEVDEDAADDVGAAGAPWRGAAAVSGGRAAVTGAASSDPGALAAGASTLAADAGTG